MLKSRCVISFASALKLETKSSRVHSSRTIDFRGKLLFPYFPDEDFGYRYICAEIYMKMEKRSAESCRILPKGDKRVVHAVSKHFYRANLLYSFLAD